MSIGQPASHLQAKLCKMAALPARLSQGPGVPVPRGLWSSAQTYEEGIGAKQWMRNK